jgi:hypothetical protein
MVVMLYLIKATMPVDTIFLCQQAFFVLRWAVKTSTNIKPKLLNVRFVNLYRVAAVPDRRNKWSEPVPIIGRPLLSYTELKN